MSAGQSVAGEPHYVREYRRLLRNLRKNSASETEAYERAVGGSYRKKGEAQAALIRESAPEGAFHLIDVGCGSGRLAYALRGETQIAYSGFDIMPELVAHAEKVCERPDWRFETISALAVPVPDASADLIAFMSVFTHLKRREIETYLAEARRVFKPGGRILASYLDPHEPKHTKPFLAPPLQRIARLLGKDVMLTRTARAELTQWMEAAGLRVERAVVEGPIGQHVLIARKPEPAA